MKQILITMMVLLLIGCAKDEVLIPDYMDGVPDARFAGTWYADKISQNDYYRFSNDNNIGERFFQSLPGQGSLLMAYKFYWRKKKEGHGFESKLITGSGEIKDSKSKEGEEWIDMELEWVDETTIKNSGRIYTK